MATQQSTWNLHSSAPSESAVILVSDDIGDADVAANLRAIAAGLAADGFATVWCGPVMLRVSSPGCGT